MISSGKKLSLLVLFETSASYFHAQGKSEVIKVVNNSGLTRVANEFGYL